MVAALSMGGRGLGDPGCAAPRGGRAVLRARAVESRGGEDLKARAESWMSAVAGPKTAGGQSFRHVDAGAGMIRTVRPIPVRESDCGLQLAARPSWRQSCGGLLRPTGELHALRTLHVHRRDGLGPNGCVNPLWAVPACGETAGGQALRGGRDHAVAGAPWEESGACRIFHENRLPTCGLWPAHSLPSSS